MDPTRRAPRGARLSALLVASLIAVGQLAASQEADASVTLRLSATSAPTGTVVTGRITGAGERCVLTVRAASPAARTRVRREVGSRFRLRLTQRIGVGRRIVRVSCGRQGATRRLRVIPDPHSRLGNLPADGGLSDRLEVEAAVGGGAFATRVPFATGSVRRVTQGPNGGFSHGNVWNRHAVDIGAPVGTAVHAGFTGVVAAATGGCRSGLRNRAPISRGCNGGYGNLVLLKHVDGTCALHAHLETITVATGQQVTRYSVLGTVGLSGSTWGPHLHFDRRDCASRISLPWGFDENPAPREGQDLVSSNEPPPPEVPQATRPPVGGTPGPGPTPLPGPVAGPGTPPGTVPGSPPATRVLTVDNRVTNGAGMREDPTPTRLNTRPWVRCSTRGCAIGGTERGSGGTYDAAVCQTQGERTTNGSDASAADDANPELFTSTRYYGVRLGDGTFGYVSEVWIRAADRGGLGLPGC